MRSANVVEHQAAREETTLAALCHRIARTQVPSRFSTMLQLCAPLAVQCWNWGLPRTAGWLGAASLFGLWALAQQKLAGYSDQLDPSPPSSATQQRVWRVLRDGTAVVGGLTTLVLVLEAFAQVMSRFGCLGCAG